MVQFLVLVKINFMKKHIILLASCIALIQAKAQNHEDVFRYSLYNYQGTPRSMATAGAWGAVGADLSSASINPAGIALYRRNELVTSMSFNSYSADASYGTSAYQNSHDYKLGFNIPNIGFVLTQTNPYMGKDAKKGLVAYQLAFGMNRLADFNQNITIVGNTNNNSISDYFAQLAKGKDSSAFFNSDYDNTLYALSRRIGLIQNTTDGRTYSSIQKLQNDTDYTMLETQTFNNKGRMYEWYISGGLNFSNLIYLGGSFIIQDVNFGSEMSFKESLTESSVVKNIYESSTVSSSLTTKGSGIGGRIGMILRPTDFLRLGVSYQTPVILSLKDEYNNSLKASTTDGNTYSQPGDKRVDFFEYRITTPGRFGFQTAVILPQFGLFSFDYDLVDYRSGRLAADGTNQAYMLSKNIEVNQKYQQAANYRAGFEMKADYMKFRVGYAYLGSPYNPSEVSEANGSRKLYSAGLGFAFDEQVSFDFGMNYITGKNFSKTYETNQYSATTNFTRILFAMGMSVKF